MENFSTKQEAERRVTQLLREVKRQSDIIRQASGFTYALKQIEAQSKIDRYWSKINSLELQWQLDIKKLGL